MSSLRCTVCGANYYTALTGPYLQVAALLYRCESCGAWEPLQIRATAAGGTADAVTTVAARSPRRATRERRDPAIGSRD